MTIGISKVETSQSGLSTSDAEKAEVLVVFFSSVFTHENTDEISSILRT